MTVMNTLRPIAGTITTRQGTTAPALVTMMMGTTVPLGTMIIATTHLPGTMTKVGLVSS